MNHNAAAKGIPDGSVRVETALDHADLLNERPVLMIKAGVLDGSTVSEFRLAENGVKLQPLPLQCARLRCSMTLAPTSGSAQPAVQLGASKNSGV